MSDDFLGFEPIDDELRRRLGAAGPPANDPGAALQALTPRYRRARRRHQMVVAVGSALAIVAAVAIGTVALTSVGSGGGRNVQTPPANTGAPDRASTTTTAVPVPAPTTPPQPTAAPTGGGSTPAAGGDGPAATTPTAAQPEQRTYTSAGGSVTVKLQSGALSIVSTQAASGYSEDRHDTGPDRVEVRFDNTKTEWRIRVDLSNGEPVVAITQN